MTPIPLGHTVKHGYNLYLCQNTALECHVPIPPYHLRSPDRLALEVECHARPWLCLETLPRPLPRLGSVHDGDDGLLGCLG